MIFFKDWVQSQAIFSTVLFHTLALEFSQLRVNQPAFTEHLLWARLCSVHIWDFRDYLIQPSLYQEKNWGTQGEMIFPWSFYP